MCSSTSSEGPRLVRIAVPCTCAQTRVVIEMHSRTTVILLNFRFSLSNPMIVTSNMLVF